MRLLLIAITLYETRAYLLARMMQKFRFMTSQASISPYYVIPLDTRLVNSSNDAVFLCNMSGHSIS